MSIQFQTQYASVDRSDTVCLIVIFKKRNTFILIRNRGRMGASAMLIYMSIFFFSRHTDSQCEMAWDIEVENTKVI